jgi:hypothetical protein
LLETLISLVLNPQRQERYGPILGKQFYKIGELAIELEYLLGPAADRAAIEGPVEVWRANLLEVEMALETLVDVTGQIVGGKLIATEKLPGLALFCAFCMRQCNQKLPNSRYKLTFNRFTAASQTARAAPGGNSGWGCSRSSSRPIHLSEVQQHIKPGDHDESNAED